MEGTRSELKIMAEMAFLRAQNVIKLEGEINCTIRLNDLMFN
jgi:hypothetical protein